MNNVRPERMKEIAKDLLDTGAVKLRPGTPFKWASGWNSPIYCDNRITLSFPEVRTRIKEYLCEEIKKHYPEVNLIAGVATAGIPQAALVADKMGLPLAYVRSKPKGHGMENLIEGKVSEGQNAVVIEDLVSTGGSSLKAVSELKKAGVNVLGMAAIFTYGFPVADENFEAAGIKLITLSNYNALIKEAQENGFVEEADLNSLRVWRENPGEWNKD